MSLQDELRSEQVRHLDLSGYCVVANDTPVRQVLEQMRAQRGRTALVTEGDRLVGIFTERDVLNKVVMTPETLDQPVSAVMTPRPITVLPDTPAADALWLMDDHHFRNLPVIDRQGNILGDMTHAAIIRFLAARFPVEVLNRPPHPEQYPRKAEGGA